MVMKNKHQKSSKTSEQDNPQSSSDHGPDSPISADFSTPTTAIIASSNKSRRGIQKRVVSIPIQDADGSRSKAEAYPPSDSWAWRKYGQKPIKGSPYPRGYYRCSTSKGCPARKQVERSRVDPTMLIITYACEHNHPLPTTKQQQQQHHHHNNHQPSEAAASATENSASPSSSSCIADCGEEASPSSPSHVSLFGIGDPPELEFVRDSSTLVNLGVEFNWISDLTFGTPALVQPKSEVIEVSTLSMEEEDKLLFGDLGELPECSLVFRHRHGNIERCTNSTPICGRLIL